MRTHASVSGVSDAAPPAFTTVPRGLVHRRCAACSAATPDRREDESPLLRLRRGSAPEPEQVPPIVHEVLRSPGQPLDPSTRRLFHRQWGVDFINVRLHTDARASRSADAVDARAYTVGSDIVFARGILSPASREGLALLAHELAHVVQQGHPVSPMAGPLTLGAPSSVAEGEADRAARRLVALASADHFPASEGARNRAAPGGGTPFPGLARTAVQVQRQCEGRTVRNCAGTPCQTAAGRRGVCQWGGLTYGCRCRDQSGDEPRPGQALEMFPGWLLALLSAAALALLIACIASGACAAGAIIGAAGATAGVAIIGILRANGVTVSEGGDTA